MAESEFKILESLEHPHIIRALDFFTSPLRAVIVLEYFQGMTLEVAVKQAQHNVLLEVVVCPLFKALLQAVCHLHERRLIHRDIKGSNVMVSHDFKDLRLLDFNVAKSLAEGGALTMTGAHLYSGPEVLWGESPAEPNDVWGCGLCLHLMLFGQMPWRSHHSPTSLAEHIAKQKLRFGDKKQPISNPCRAVLRQCLMVDKRFRPAPITLLTHQWFWNCPTSEPAPQRVLHRCAKFGRLQSI